MTNKIKTLSDLINEVNWKIVEILKREGRISDEQVPTKGDMDEFFKTAEATGKMSADILHLFLVDEGSYTIRIIDSFTEYPEDNEAHEAKWQKNSALTDVIISEINYRSVTHEGGGIGGSESCMSVVCFGSEHYRFNFRYMSYHGYFIDADQRAIRVEPRRVEIIQFFEMDEQQ